MSTLIDVVEGISNSVLSYFFDPKEPVIQLKPISTKPIDLHLLTEVGRQLCSDDYQVHQGNYQVRLVTTQGRRQFVTAGDLQGGHEFHSQWERSTANPDTLHLANMSALWHHIQRFKKGRGYSQLNFLWATKYLVTLLDSNRGRLVKFELSEANGMIRFDAIISTAKPNQFTHVHFESDNIHWDLSERSPIVVDAPYIVSTRYDREGRISMVVKRNATELTQIYGSLEVEYTDDHPFPQQEVQGVAWSVIPTPLIKLLELSYITHVKDTICPVTGSRFYTYSCVTEHKRCVTVTVRH